jgi:hypothetical protein
MNRKDLKEELFREILKRGLLEQEEMSDEMMSDEMETDTQENESFCELACRVLHSRTQAHVFHLQTKSFAEHKALNDYYDGVLGLYDGLVESYQGKYGLLMNVKSFENQDYQSSEQVIGYFEDLVSKIDENRNSVDDSYLQNQIDTIVELIYSTIYKLKFLK